MTRTPAEYARLYEACHPKVLRLALGLTGNAGDAEEITQEAFFRGFRAFATYRAESSFFTWIYRITLNVANDYLRHRAKTPVQALADRGYAIEEVVDPDPQHNPEYELLAKEARYMCLHCLTECLPNEQRKIFCLAVTLGLPQKQVAEIMECSLSKVKTTLYRAKQRWFGYMENRCRFINRTNPCHCQQWVRYGLEQGWLNPDEPHPGPEVDMQVLREVRNLKALRQIYAALYPEAGEQALVHRLKDGIKNKEWAILG